MSKMVADPSTHLPYVVDSSFQFDRVHVGTQVILRTTNMGGQSREWDLPVALPVVTMHDAAEIAESLRKLEFRTGYRDRELHVMGIEEYKDGRADVGDGLNQSAVQQKLNERTERYRTSAERRVVRTEDFDKEIHNILQNGPPPVKLEEEYFGDLQSLVGRESATAIPKEGREQVYKRLRFEGQVAQGLWNKLNVAKQRASHYIERNKELERLCIDICKHPELEKVLPAEILERLQAVGEARALAELESDLKGSKQSSPTTVPVGTVMAVDHNGALVPANSDKNHSPFKLMAKNSAQFANGLDVLADSMTNMSQSTNVQAGRVSDLEEKVDRLLNALQRNGMTY